MFKRYSLLLSCLALPLAVWAFADWQSYTIDERLSLQLPAPPQEFDLTKYGIQPADMRAFMTADEVGIYQICRLGLTPEQAAHIRTPTDLEEFYGGVQQAFLGDVKGQLLAKTTFQTPVGEGIELKYRAPSKVFAGKNIGYMRAVFAGKASYSFIYLPRALADSTSSRAGELRQRFFSSIAVGSGKPTEKLLLHEN